MGAQEENGLSLEQLDQRFEAMQHENAERLATVQRENAERLETLERENAELRSKVVALEGSGTSGRDEVPALRGSDTRGEEEPASAREGRVSRRSLLSKAGAAAVAAMAAGTLMYPRQAKASHWGDSIFTDHVYTHSVDATAEAGSRAITATNDSELDGFGTISAFNNGSGSAVSGESNGPGPAIEGEAAGGTGVKGTGRYGVWGESNLAGFYGITGRNTLTDGTGVRGVTSDVGRAGVRGEGAIGVWGSSSKTDHGAVYGQHTGSKGYGLVGDGKGNGSGVLGRNNSGVGYEAFGVKGETADAIGVKGIGRIGVVGESPAGGHAAVYGHHTGSSGYGVVGDGTGPSAGVLGRNNSGYGGEFEGGKAQLKLKPAASAGKPTTGTHTKGEIYMDKAGALFVCTAGDGTTVGTWKKVTMKLV